MAPTIHVAVCTNRGPDAAAESLAALAEQVPAERLWLVLSGPDVRAGAPEAGGARVLHEPREGLSRARNRALAEVADEDVLAFVDDDAVIGEGWLEALAAAWREASAEVACIGGPIRPRWNGARPDWLSDPLLPVLTLLDLGAEPRDLDPRDTTVYGANISFRAGPLRRVGGFDPAFGHSGARIGFSEEDEAQRALAGLGYRVRYAPGPAVEHVIPAERLTPRSFMRRRYAYGRALGARGVRSPAFALRRLASSAAGSIAARAAGDERLRMERAVRAAENAGVLAGAFRGLNSAVPSGD